MINRVLFVLASVLGAVAILWMGASFLYGHGLALGVTVVIGLAYLIGIAELLQFRRVTQSLAVALETPPDVASDNADPLQNWLLRLDPSLQQVSKLRVEGQQVPLPAPILTSYLVGLLVMLGLLGTFFGMVDTLSGAVVALQGNTDLAAIRAGLAAPIAGLGVAFGTSVAGVAASAMLGLGATLSRRDRLLAVNQLNIYADREFRRYSQDHRRQQAFDAMQDQSAALPGIVEKLDQLTDKVSAMTSDLGDQLLANQAEFQQSAAADYRELANSVGASLQYSLAESGKLAGDSIRPALESAMANFNDSAARVHAQLSEVAAEQSRASSRQSVDTIQKIQETVAQGLSDQQHSQQRVIEQFEQTLNGTGTQLLDTASKVQGIVSEGLSEQQLAQQRIAEQFEQALADTLAKLGHAAQQQSEQQLSRVGELLAASEQLLEARMDSEASWLEQHSERMEHLATALGDQLGQLRSDEEQRASAAVDRLAALEATVADHLGKLGNELQAPMTRLIETASETPRAAAEVITRLRQELSNSIERDNQLLEERELVLERLQTLLASLESSSAGQRDAAEQMVSSSAAALVQLGDRVGDQIGEGVSRISGLTDDIVGSAAQVASLGDAFQQAVQQFGESNQALIDSLDRIEQGMDQSATRSDEQLGYYVAQAREIIDHSMLSQKEIIEELRHLGRQEELFEAET